MPVHRKAANLSLDAELLEEARSLKINLSRAAESGIANAIRKQKELAWKAENAEAIAYSNAFVEKNGLPLAKYRQF